jgi:hypothetical protein
MLSSTSAAVVEATLPVVVSNLDQISGTFYDTMLGENPDQWTRQQVDLFQAEAARLCSSSATRSPQCLGAGRLSEYAVDGSLAAGSGRRATGQPTLSCGAVALPERRR